MADAPLVSCIMPTRDRRAFAARAIDWFLRQDYANRELVVVDDGTDRITDLAARDARIRYVPVERRLTIGAKRNLACEHASGSLIAHWDDDDWHAPDRLSRQVAALRTADADLCGTSRLLFYDISDHRSLEYVYPGANRRWLAGGTLLYRRDLWRRRPFANRDVGEDGDFVTGARGARFANVPDPPFYVATIHPGNTSPKLTAGSAWHSVPEAKLRALVGEDWPAFAGTRAETVPESAVHDSGARDRVTVSIPFFGARPYVLKAINSILAQTHANLRLVVVNDADPRAPWDLMRHLDDPRLVRFDLPTNRGRYFADAVVLEATPDRWFLVQDADDWSEPERVAALLEATIENAASGAVSAGLIHSRRGDPESARPGDNFPRRGQPITSDNVHRFNQVGIFRTDALRAIGGTYGGERIGYDTIFGNFLLMTGSIAYVDRPLYHRRIRPDSLSNSPETGLRSEHRATVWRRLYELYRPAFEAYEAYRAGHINATELARRLRAIRDSCVPGPERVALAAEAARLRHLLRAQDARWGAEPALFEPRPAPRSDVWDDARARGIAADRRLRWNAWTVTPALATALADRLIERRPTRILEIGSGNSTAILAAHAAVTGATVTTLEHEPAYRAATATMLAELGLRGRVDLRLAPIRQLATTDGTTAPWYETTLEGAYDFVFVDGPPQRIGREGVLFGIAPHLAASWELWLDDGNRPHELACLERWRHHIPFDGTLHDVDWKGLWVLHEPGIQLNPVEQAAKARIGPLAPRLGAKRKGRARSASSAPTAVAGRDGAPLVSAIMPTYDRRPFIRRAIAQFLQQTYPRLELIIVDDGSDPIGDLVPDDPRIRYVRLDGRRSIGVKRNVACEEARGEIVIGWDDDDWYSPRRITRQVEPILEERADATGLAETLMLDLQADRYWRFAPQLGNRIFEGGLVSGTLAFARRLWVDGLRYPDASLAEDAAFQRALAKRGARIQRMPEDDLFIYLRHGSNSWRFTPGTFVDRSGWQSVPPPAFLGAEDLEAFRELRRAIASVPSARAPGSAGQRARPTSTARLRGQAS